MARTPDPEPVTAQVEAFCHPFLRLSSALTMGCMGISALSLVGVPIAFLLLGEEGFWTSLGAGLALGIAITVALAAVTGFLDGHLTSRTADKFNRRFPLGRDRDLAISALQQRHREVTGDKEMSMTSLLEALSVPVPPATDGVEGAPVEAQVAEALETLAAEREEGSPVPPAEPEAAAVPPPRRAGDEPPRRLRSGGVIPLQPEGADDPPARRPVGRTGKHPRQETAS